MRRLWSNTGVKPIWARLIGLLGCVTDSLRVFVSTSRVVKQGLKLISVKSAFCKWFLNLNIRESSLADVNGQRYGDKCRLGDTPGRRDGTM